MTSLLKICAARTKAMTVASLVASSLTLGACHDLDSPDLNAATTGTAGTVKEKTKEGAEKTKEGAKTVGEKTKDGAKVVGEKTKDGAVKVGDEVTDAYLISKLNTDFVNEDTLKGSNINVDSDNQVVTLKGTVMSEAGRARALAIAKGTKGVKRVIDNLTIGPKK